MEYFSNSAENEALEVTDNFHRRHFVPDQISYGWSVFVEMPDILSNLNFLTTLILGGIGVILNVIALIVLFDWNLMKRKQFVLIRSLTIVDLLSCLSAIVYALPALQSIVVPSGSLGDFLCALIFSRFIFYTLSAVSAWHLVMISFERYLSIIHTDWYDLHFTRFMNVLMIVISYAIGVYTMNYNLWAYEQNNGTCILEWPEPRSWEVYAGVNEFVFMVVLPIFIMGFFYSSVYHRYKEFSAFYTHANVAIDVTSGGREIKNPKSVRMTLLVLMLVYIVSWFPNELLWLIYSVGMFDVDDAVYTEAPSFITQLLVNLNAVCNPILYASSYSEFRYLFKTKVGNLGVRIGNWVKCKRCRKRQKVHSIQERHPTGSQGYRVTANRAPSQLPDIFESAQPSDIESLEDSGSSYRTPYPSFPSF